MGISKTKWLGDRLFFTKTKYTLVTTQEEHDNAFKSLGLKNRHQFLEGNCLGSCTLFTIPEGDRIIVSIDPEQGDGIKIATTIVHEAVHVWQFIKDDIGESNPSVEFEAYTIDCIFDDLASYYREHII